MGVLIYMVCFFKSKERTKNRAIAFFLGLVYFITPHVFVCLTIRTLNPLVIEIGIFFLQIEVSF